MKFVRQTLAFPSIDSLLLISWLISGNVGNIDAFEGKNFITAITTGTELNLSIDRKRWCQYLFTIFHLANNGPYMSPRNDSLNGRQLLQGEHNLHILFHYIYIAEIVFEIILATKIASVNTMRYPFAVLILYKQYEVVFAIKKQKQTNKLIAVLFHFALNVYWTMDFANN